MKLSHWEVDGYRSIGEAQFEPDDFNIFIGRNNSGKSNISQALIDYIGQQHSMLTSVPYSSPNWDDIITRNKGYEEVKISFGFDCTGIVYDEIIQGLEEKGVGESYIEFVSNTSDFNRIQITQSYTEGGLERELKILLPETGLTLLESSRSGVQVRDLPPENHNRSTSGSYLYDSVADAVQSGLTRVERIDAFRKPDDTMPASRVDSLDQSGSDLVQVLDTMARNHPEQFAKVEETYADIMEGVTGLRTPFVSGRATTIMVEEEGFSDGFSLSEISAGSKEILTLITKIVKAEENAEILFLEEPELHIHPSAQQAIYDLMRDVCANGGPQMFVTTHSDVFVDQTDSSNIISVKRNVETTLEKVDDGGVDELLESLGYEKSEVLQAKAAAFVEGVSDQSVFNQFSETLADAGVVDRSLEELGVTVRSLGGDRLKRHGKELHDSFGHLRIPHCFITDSDDQDSDDKADELRETLGGAEVHVLDGYCIESYLLEHSCAIADAFSLDEETVAEYIEDAADRPNKKSVLDDLIQDLTGKQGGYDEREHSWIIARHVEASEISDEIVELIERLEELSQ
jgi:predicted ATPase